MAELKTKPTSVSPASFVAGIPDAATRHDCRTPMAMMKKATGAAPKMRGTSIVGYGRSHHVYESGREGDWFEAERLITESVKRKTGQGDACG